MICNSKDHYHDTSSQYRIGAVFSLTLKKLIKLVVVKISHNKFQEFSGS